MMVAAMNEFAPNHPPKRLSTQSAAFRGNKGLEQFRNAYKYECIK
jgi:hypothetical protein